MKNEEFHQQQSERLTKAEISIETILEKIDRIFDEIQRINDKLDKQYVLRGEYDISSKEIRNRLKSLEVVNNRVAWFIIFTVAGALLTLVVKQNI